MAPSSSAPLSRALDQSEQVHHKVKKAGIDLSSVNAVLKHEIADGSPVAKVERALTKSENVEIKVQEAAHELAAVNDALAEEVDARRHLEHELSKSDAALSESRSKQRQLRHDSIHDPLTSLPNITLFKDRLGNALAQAKRHTWQLAVLFMDLNGFKDVNDTHGHLVGDRILQRVGERLQTIVRAGDTVCRRSGDEFLLLMLEAKDEASVATFAAKIAQAIAAPYDVDGIEITVTASIGIALYPQHGRSADDLLENADVAMYAAKHNKAGITLFSSSLRP
ncbi:MAG: GGDEF domain-containing protein [Polyangiaceae bacterium]